jgi:hypothetical protein
LTTQTRHANRKETALLASEIDYASSLLDQAEGPGRDTDTRLLFNAAESYRRTKNLLSLMELEADQATHFQGQLAVLQARLLGKK